MSAVAPPDRTERTGKPFTVQRAPLLVRVTGMLPVSPAVVAAFAGPTWKPTSWISQAATAAFFGESAGSPVFPEPPEPPSSHEVRARAAARTVTAMGRARMCSPGNRDDVHGSSRTRVRGGRAPPAVHPSRCDIARQPWLAVAA